MMEQYGFGEQPALVITLLGIFVGAGFIMSVVFLFSRPQGACAVVTYSFVQSVLSVIFGYKVLSSSWTEGEVVIPSAEG